MVLASLPKTKLMPRPERKANGALPAAAVAMGLAWLAVLAAVTLSLRMLSVELSLPANLRLDELRLFSVSGVGSPPVEWLPALAPDPLRVHARHSACQSRLRQALADHDFHGAAMARLECLGAVEEALSQSPANGRLWLERAKLVYEIYGPTRPFHDSLFASWKTAPRAGWIAIDRLRFAAAVWRFLPEESKSRAAADALIIAGSEGLSKAMAQEYARHALLRPAMADIITHRLSGQAQRQWIRVLQQATP
jgi:hypothetical protein